MAKNKIIFLSLAFYILAIHSNAWAASPLLVSVQLFAGFQAVIHDDAGHEVTNISPLVKEYRKIEVWEPAEIYTSPQNFDAIAIISIPKDCKKRTIQVHFEVSAKVGPLLSIPEGGATDIVAGEKEATWRKPEITKIVKLATVRPGIITPAYLKDIDLDSIQHKYWRQDRWPYFMRVRVWLSCDSCNPKKYAEAIMEVYPGD